MGGSATSIERFPWQMSLRINGIHRCGASVIAKNRALTAAHCYRTNSDELETFTLLAGSTLRLGDGGSIIVGVEHFIQHPNYNNETLENGILVRQEILPSVSSFFFQQKIFRMDLVLYVCVCVFLDIAVIYLQRKLLFSEKIRPVNVRLFVGCVFMPSIK